MHPIGKGRMTCPKLKMAFAAPLAPIMVPAEEPQQEARVPRVEEVQRWMEELHTYVGNGIFDPSMVLALQMQHLEYSLKMVMNEVQLIEAEQTAMNVAEFALRE